MNYFDQVREAIAEAKRADAAVKHYAEQMARLLVGSLHRCSGHTCEALKRELRDFNIQTHRWKKRR